MSVEPSAETTGIRFTLEHATKRYGEVPALQRIDLEFAAGSTTALIGSSGSGKSTVLRLLLGLEQADTGCVKVDGRILEPADVLALRRRVGYVIQDGGLFPHLTSLGNLALLLDEPLGSLDPIVRHELQDELKRIFDQLGKTVIVVTHDLAEAAWFADRLVLLRQGSVVQDGSFEDLRDRPASDFVRQFVQAQRRLPESP